MDVLQSDSNDIYLVLFHAGTNKGERIKFITESYIGALEDYEDDDQVIFYEVDATEDNFQPLAKDIGIDLSELEFNPSILVMHQKKGVWINGAQAIARAEELIEDYREIANLQ